MQIKIQLKGWPALIVLTLFLGNALFLGWYRYYSVKKAMPEVKEQARIWVVSDQAREILASTSRSDLDTMSGEELKRLSDTLAHGTQVEVTSIDLRGNLFGTMVVRVEYTVDGKPPKDGGVRYYGLRYSLLLGTTYPDYEFYRMLPFMWHLAFWR